MAIAYHPEIAKTLGNVEACILFCQLYYWQDKGIRNDGYIWKSTKELVDETGMTEYAIEKARKILVDNGYIEIIKKKANGAPTLHYKLLKVINVSISGIGKGEGHLIRKGEGREMEKAKVGKSITENTTEITHNNTTNTCDKVANENIIKVLDEFKKWNPAIKSMYGNKTQRKACKDLVDTYGIEIVLKAIEILPEINKKAYTKKSITPYDLWHNWVNYTFKNLENKNKVTII